MVHSEYDYHSIVQQQKPLLINILFELIGNIVYAITGHVK